MKAIICDFFCDLSLSKEDDCAISFELQIDVLTSGRDMINENSKDANAHHTHTRIVVRPNQIHAGSSRYPTPACYRASQAGGGAHERN